MSSTNDGSADISNSTASESDVDMDSDSVTTINGDRSDHEATPRPEFINENDPLKIMPFLGRVEQPPEHHDVCVVGAGPAGLMLGLTLARLGITPLILDERAEQTPAGRADGMQPKTIETLRMLGLADELLQRGVRVYDICLWHGGSGGDDSGATPTAASEAPAEQELRRVARETHYPAFIVDLMDPFVLIGHQGMIERVFVADLAKRGVAVRRCHKFDGVSVVKAAGTTTAAAAGPDGLLLQVHTHFNVTRDTRSFDTAFLVGCDGAHSRVRKFIRPSSSSSSADGQREALYTSEMSVWGVLDGEVDTDFPDIWTKTVVFSERYGSILVMPRERDMTRLYIEMRPDAAADAAAGGGPPAGAHVSLVQAAIMRRAAQILLPYRIRWRTVEWFGQYRVSQRVAPKFACPIPRRRGGGSDEDPAPEPRVFIAGDAAHTHSPKASQGMNTALHDSWNLAWKLNLAVRRLCRPAVLLGSYEAERQKIARDLVAFDFEHANELSRGDPAALADNFRKNVRFISGVGVEYGEESELNVPSEGGFGLGAKPGCTLPPGKVSRYIDANPVDVQLDIPVLGQFKVYIFVPDVVDLRQSVFLGGLCLAIAEGDSLISRLSAAASKSYLERPRVPSTEDIFKRPERYTAVSQLFAFALITSTPKPNFELSDLPPILSRSPWTVYLDNVPDLDTQGSTCTAKYLGPLASGEVAIMNVRPDGYVGSLSKWNIDDSHDPLEVGKTAAAWLDRYFGGFLAVPGS
ncbi:unnamed protein product [Discula destructiva]